MGNYNSQYESYYSKFGNNKRASNPYAGYSYKGSMNSKDRVGGNYFTRRLLRELIGVFCLLFLVLISKSIATPQTMAVYNYSKDIINKNYDYTYLVDKVKSLNITNVDGLQQKVQDIIESLKVKITGGQTIQDTVKNNFTAPILGEIINSNENAIDISAAKGSEVKAVFDGTVKECGENKTIGKYILINHGSGIESRYSNLSEISVENNGTVKKGNIIGKSGDNGNLAEQHLHFELIYMGKNNDPLEYISFGS